MLAHELRNPLAPLRTAVELLGRPNVAESTKQRARDIMTRQLARMSTLIDELGDFGRLGAGKMPLRSEVTALGDVVDAAVASAREVIDEKQLVLLVDLPAHGPAVHGDRERFAQALAKVLRAAAGRSEPGRRVWLRAMPQATHVAVTVHDEGAGIEGEPARAPVPGFEALPPETPAGDLAWPEGFTLGLAVAQRLVVAQGGALRMRRDRASGAVDTVLWLPLAAAGQR